MNKTMPDDLQVLETTLLSQLHAAKTLEELEAVRIRALGKQGTITALMKSLGNVSVSPEERKEKGILYNSLREKISSALESQKEKLEVSILAGKLSSETIDVTLPSKPSMKGSVHPVSQAWFELVEIFHNMGFWVAEGPEIETDFNNFSALNIPPEHPARQEQDTFYMPAGGEETLRVLRTHTSPVQVRTMLNKKPPIRIIAPGRVYRSDYDQTHTPCFHQVEGLFIAKDIHMGHLKQCIEEMCSRIFHIPDLPVRFRPAFFPFTEPSAEVDIACGKKDGQLVIGGGNDWLEILGCGMVHPKVLQNCGIDPDEYQGFAFGMGIERIAMLKYGIPDLRSFYEGDVRWLSHYGFSYFEALMGEAVQ